MQRSDGEVRVVGVSTPTSVKGLSALSGIFSSGAMFSNGVSNLYY